MNHFYKNIVHEIINCNKSKFKLTKNIYFYDISNKFPIGTLLDDVVDSFRTVFPSSKILFINNYKYKCGIIVKKLKK